MMSEEINSANRLPALPAGSTASPTKRHRRKKTLETLYRRRANRIYELQVREYIVRRRHEHQKTDAEIAAELALPLSTVKKYFKKSLSRVVKMLPPAPLDPDEQSTPQPQPRDDAEQPWRRDRQRQRRSEQAPPSHPGRAKGVEFIYEGEVLPSPDELLQRKEALRLAKSAVPYAEMADYIGIPEDLARQYVHEELTKLEKSEINTTDLQRRLMIEQIDQMIAAVHAPATGQKIDGSRTMPVLEAVDRLMRLLKQKAELMGLDRPQYTDITIKLEALAVEAGYDMQELEEVARDVLAQHRIKLPGFRSG